MISESDDPCGIDDTLADLLWSQCDYGYGPSGHIVTPALKRTVGSAHWDEQLFDEYVVPVLPFPNIGSSLEPVQLRFEAARTTFLERYLNGAFVGFSLAIALWWVWSIRTADGLSATSHSMRASLLAVSLLTGVIGYAQSVRRQSHGQRRTGRTLEPPGREASRMRSAAQVTRLPRDTRRSR